MPLSSSPSRPFLLDAALLLLLLLLLLLRSLFENLCLCVKGWEGHMSGMYCHKQDPGGSVCAVPRCT